MPKDGRAAEFYEDRNLLIEAVVPLPNHKQS